MDVRGNGNEVGPCQVARPASAWQQSNATSSGQAFRYPDLGGSSSITLSNSMSLAGVMADNPTKSTNCSPKKMAPWEENLQATSWPDYLHRYSMTKGQVAHQGPPPPISTHKEHWVKDMQFHPILQRWLAPKDEAVQEEKEKREADRLTNRNKGIRAAMQTTKAGEFPFRMVPEPDRRKPYGVPPKLRSNLFDILGDQQRPKVVKVPKIRKNANDTRSDHHIINNFPLPGVPSQDGPKRKPTAELQAVAEKLAFRFDPVTGGFLTEEGREYERKTRTVDKFQRRPPPPDTRVYNWMTLTGEGGEKEVMDLDLGNRRKNIDSIISNVEREREAQAERDIWRLHHHQEVLEAYTEKIMAEPFRSKKGGYVKKEEDFPQGYNIVNLAPSTASSLQQATNHALPPVVSPASQKSGPAPLHGPIPPHYGAGTPPRAKTSHDPDMQSRPGALPPATVRFKGPGEDSEVASRLPTANTGLPRMPGNLQGSSRAGGGGAPPGGGKGMEGNRSWGMEHRRPGAEAWRSGWVREGEFAPARKGGGSPEGGPGRWEPPQVWRRDEGADWG